MKSTWAYPDLLSATSGQLADLNNDVSWGSIVGIETGGSPYATLMSQQLDSSLVLMRKVPKNENQYAGLSHDGGEKDVLVVDDIIATGQSARLAIEGLKGASNRVRLTAFISYGMDRDIGRRYGIEVTSRYGIDDVLDVMDSDSRRQVVDRVISYQDLIRSEIGS